MSTLTEQASPWMRETERCLTLIDRLASNTEGPVQGIVIDEATGFGTGRLLDMVAATLIAEGETPARLSRRHDTVFDWPSLALEILAAAHRAGAPHGETREQLTALRAEFGPVAFRDEVDRQLKDALEQHGRLTLLVPHLHTLLEKVGDKDQWAFRNVLQSYPLALLGTAAIEWRPGREEAFFEFFRRTRPRGYEAADLKDLSARFRLKKPERETLNELSAMFDGRPNLIEAGAATLSLQTKLPADDIIRQVADTTVPDLWATLTDTADQALRVLAEASYIDLPSGSGEIADATGLPSGAVSSQLSRLEETKIIQADKKRGRNRQYDFQDPVVSALYQALIHLPRGAEEH